jgi:VIT1/CCC1 family predicted Fe2+/Mn2+ transporter
MKISSIVQQLRTSLSNSAGTIVFGMEDGTVSIFGLIFGVAATTTDTKTVLIAGATGAAAAAVSMMAGAYLDVETTRDEINATRVSWHAAAGSTVSLSSRLARAGLTSEQSDALAAAVQKDPKAIGGLLLALQGAPETPLNPWEQALWMLLADFLAAAVPICHLYSFRSFRQGSSPAQSQSLCSSGSALDVHKLENSTQPTL